MLVPPRKNFQRSKCLLSDRCYPRTFHALPTLEKSQRSPELFNWLLTSCFAIWKAAAWISSLESPAESEFIPWNTAYIIAIIIAAKITIPQPLAALSVFCNSVFTSGLVWGFMWRKIGVISAGFRVSDSAKLRIFSGNEVKICSLQSKKRHFRRKILVLKTPFHYK